MVHVPLERQVSLLESSELKRGPWLELDSYYYVGQIPGSSVWKDRRTDQNDNIEIDLDP